MKKFTRMVTLAVFGILTIPGAYALDQKLEGAQFVGVDSVSNKRCKVRIEKIEKAFMVDKVTVAIQLGQDSEWKIELGEYDLTTGSYVAYRGQNDIEFAVDKKGTSADYLFYHYNRDGFVDMPVFSSGAVTSHCEHLKRIDSTAHRDERVNQSAGKVVSTGVIATPISDAEAGSSGAK